MLGALSDESKQKILDVRLANAPYATLKMGLSQANLTPDHATTLTTLVSSELSVSGYARVDLVSWAAAILTADFHAYSEADLVTFTNTGGSAWPTAFTWFWVDTTLTKLVRSGRFAAPFALDPGQSITFIPFEQETGE